ncbi:hypothetical protein Tco_0651901 [Tanacetum coccineum]|uniref:Uncharacterized protein n=1 Tax=Tanacetum coccineum TaxID=301880 RepID=A0ABQ4WW27_9ASTR
MWVRNPNQKSSASQWLNGSHHPPLAQTPFAALITRSRGTLLGGLHDDSQSEVFYYAIFISSKTGLGGFDYASGSVRTKKFRTKGSELADRKGEKNKAMPRAPSIRCSSIDEALSLSSRARCNKG